MTTFRKCVLTCRIPGVGNRYTSCRISDSALRRIFDSTKEFRILRSVSSHMLDLPSVFKIDKILYVQDWSVCHVTVCLYLHRGLASLVLRLLAIIFANYPTR